jgi:hypothetical protein
MIEGACPVCGNHLESKSPLTLISCTIRCKKCDSSIGLSIGFQPSVVYTEVPQEKWITKPKDYS